MLLSLSINLTPLGVRFPHTRTHPHIAQTHTHTGCAVSLYLEVEEEVEEVEEEEKDMASADKPALSWLASGRLDGQAHR